MPLRVDIITGAVIVRVQFVFDPPLRIGCDVFGNPVVIGLVSDNVFVIITLPDRQAGRIADFVDTFRYGGFE